MTKLIRSMQENKAPVLAIVAVAGIAAIAGAFMLKNNSLAGATDSPLQPAE
ncbi:MAG TPA: hypothetical protein VGE31_01620 [Candidatus Paceibacterota bacterium]